MLISISLEPLEFRTDNPGGNWLREEQDYNLSKGVNKHGCPSRFGATTGWFKRKVLLPVSVLSSLRGLSGEQNAVRPDSLEWLTKHMKRYKRLPYVDSASKRHYSPYIMVWQDGTPYVNEGNHRIMAAQRLGFKYLPIEISYFSGAEQKDSSVLSPDKVKAYDSDAHSEGFTVTKYH